MSEGFTAVGQWSPVLSIALALAAAGYHHLGQRTIRLEPYLGPLWVDFNSFTDDVEAMESEELMECVSEGPSIR